MMTHALLLLLTVLPAMLFAPKRHTVAMVAFQFVPQTIVVSVGDTIVWENRDIVPHTATANDASWDSGLIPAKGSHTTVARKAGTHPFTCLYHSNMKGSLVVR
jgi:plastocyanin